MTDQVAVDDGGVATTDEAEGVNTAAHEARLKYEAEFGPYESFARSVAGVLERCLEDKQIKPQGISAQAKKPDEFERKAAQAIPGSTTAKYSDPLSQITDKAGVRVITYLLRNVDEVAKIISNEFEVIERLIKESGEPDRFGYTSLHFLVKYSDSRSHLPEYRRFKGLIVEIQVRTVLQHAWAEIEHDIQYKSPSVLPKTVSRRFASLAGLIEIADREFQAIEDEERALREDMRRNLSAGRLDVIEITPDSIQAYLDHKYGADGRMREWSYEWTTELLVRLGFDNLEHVNDCIKDYNDDLVSRAVYGSRLGQLTRFELVLLASMGENFIRAHLWARHSDTRGFLLSQLGLIERMRKAGVTVGSYRPPAFPNDALSPTEVELMKKEIEEAAVRSQAAKAPGGA